MENKKRKTALHVIIVEDHNDVLEHIYRAIGSKKLPFENGVMIHFDSHPDMMIPRNFQSEKIFDKSYVLSSLSIENWIMPAVYAKHFRSLAWIKPPWATQISEGIHHFQIGHHKITKSIQVTCSQSYFVSELMWSPVEDLENSSDVFLEVRTIGSSEKPAGTKICEESSETAIKSDSTGSTGRPDVLSPDFQKEMDATPFLLDIDLDFYSTRNPFLSLFTEQQFEMLRHLYHYEHPNQESVQALREATKRRQEQLTELESILLHLEYGGRLRDLPQTPRLSSLEPLLRTFPECRPPDPSLLNDAGCTCDDCDLPHHVSSRDHVCHLVAVTRDFLTDLPKPAFITIARSSRDDYCPPEDVDFIQDQVLQMVRDLYGPVEVTEDYELQEDDNEDDGSQIPQAASSRP